MEHKKPNCEIIKRVSEAVPVPVIASGGAGNSQDLVKAIKTGESKCSCVRERFSIMKIIVVNLKSEISDAGIGVRLQ